MKLAKLLSSLIIIPVLAVSMTGCGPGLISPGEAGPSTPMFDGTDSCLQGDWMMSNENLNTIMSSLAPIPGLSIPSGTLGMTFNGSDFSYGSNDLVLRIDIPGGYMEAEAAFLFTGTFSTSSGEISLSDVIYSAEAFVWRAVIDGETAEAPGPNALLFPLPGNGAYVCSAGSLSVQGTSGTSSSTSLYFTREP